MDAEQDQAEGASRASKRAIRILRIVPWVAFGPITGFMSNRAVSCFCKREPILGSLYIVANISILAALSLNAVSILKLSVF